jgi:hypothetical protein
MSRRRVQLVALACSAALLIAIFLRDAVEQLIIRPAAYLFWWLGVFYRFVPQPVIWFLLVLVMLFLTLNSIVVKIKLPRLKRLPPQSTLGPVGEFASQIQRRQGGIYFKWQVARTLGEIAMDLQSLHQPERRRKLDFNEKAASPQIYHYLDSGLNTSFSDYPLKGNYRLFGAIPLPGWLPLPERYRILPQTPFDIEIDPVIGYLEFQMESEDDFRRS